MTTITQKQVTSFAKSRDAKILKEMYLAAKVEYERLDKELAAFYNKVLEGFTYLDDEGNRITKSEDLYLCDDEAGVNDFYQACEVS